MSIDQSKPDSLALSWSPLLKPSHRTGPEQIVGLGIYLLIFLGFEWVGGLPIQTYGLWAVSLALSMWTLWRRNSLRLLKLELSVFLSQFLFQSAWSFSFYFLEQMLLALVALLLLWCNTLLVLLLFWKKERLSGGLLLLPLIGIFYLVGLNMINCMRL